MVSLIDYHRCPITRRYEIIGIKKKTNTKTVRQMIVGKAIMDIYMW